MNATLDRRRLAQIEKLTMLVMNAVEASAGNVLDTAELLEIDARVRTRLLIAPQLIEQGD